MDKISNIAYEAVNFYENRDIYHCMDRLGYLYNVTAQAGSLALIQTDDKFKVGKAFALFAVMANVQDKDLLSVAAENAYFCLYKVCSENANEIRAVAAYYIWALLQYAPKALQDKIVDAYISSYASNGTRNTRLGVGFVNPYYDNTTIENAMQFIISLKSYFITLFYNPKNEQLLFKEKGIIMVEVLEEVKSEYNVLPIEKQSIGDIFSQELFDEIENTLYKNYSSQR